VTAVDSGADSVAWSVMLAVFGLTSDSAEVVFVPRLLDQSFVVAVAAAAVVSEGCRRGREIL
jgi:hypothetical protein